MTWLDQTLNFWWTSCTSGPRMMEDFRGSPKGSGVWFKGLNMYAPLALSINLSNDKVKFVNWHTFSELTWNCYQQHLHKMRTPGTNEFLSCPCWLWLRFLCQRSEVWFVNSPWLWKTWLVWILSWSQVRMSVSHGKLNSWEVQCSQKWTAVHILLDFFCQEHWWHLGVWEPSESPQHLQSLRQPCIESCKRAQEVLQVWTLDLIKDCRVYTEII